MYNELRTSTIVIKWFYPGGHESVCPEHLADQRQNTHAMTVVFSHWNEMLFFLLVNERSADTFIAYMRAALISTEVY